MKPVVSISSARTAPNTNLPGKDLCSQDALGDPAQRTNTMKKSLIKQFVGLRRDARKAQEQINALLGNIEAKRRRAFLLEAMSPFGRAQPTALRDQADMLEPVCAAQANMLRMIGVELLVRAPQIDALTTFEERCDLVGVNVADRSDLPVSAGLAAMILSGGEDSAAGRVQPWTTGPLHDAIQAEQDRLMFHTEEAQARIDELYRGATGPGGKFHPDGSLRRSAHLSLVPRDEDENGGAQ